MPQSAAHAIVGLMQPMKRSWMMDMVAIVLPIVGLITMLFALAVLQLRWSAKVSETERARLQQNLQQSTNGFQSAFAQDLLGICQTLQASQTRNSHVLADRLFDRYAVWRRISGHAALIDDLYIWTPSGKQPNLLLRLNPQTRKLEPATRTASLHILSTQSHTQIDTWPRQQKTWIWDGQIPALIHPIYALRKDGNTERPRFIGYLFVVFHTQNFEQVYLPNLGRKYFPLSNGFVFQLDESVSNHERQVVYQSDKIGFTYQLVENAGEREPHVVYQSEKHVPAGIFEHADADIPLLDDSTQYRAAGPASSAMSASAESDPVLLAASATPKWRIAVRHRSGSVDAAVASLRRRDMAVSLVVLVMLLVSLMTILAATRRARKLAQLQMEFASGVSHELRTPLAVISAAAENLADGVVIEGERVRDYGALIHKESQRLSGMVDHILNFAQLDSQHHSYRLERVTVEKLVEAVLDHERPLIQAAGVTLEMDIQGDLPMLFTNAQTLQQCLQNLLSNALKYGSGGGRILLAASTAHEYDEDRVLIRVQDFGAGIAPEELSHIYEPFYRAPEARDSQIRGTGLGLSLTRKMMDGLHGQITVESSLGKGSAFTLHIPVASGEDLRMFASESPHSA